MEDDPQYAICLTNINDEVQAYCFDGVRRFSEKYSASKHLPMIEAMLRRSTYLCSVDSMFKYNDPQIISQLTHEHMERIINEFNRDIKLASTDQQKLREICKTIQRIDQLHPFIDGNIRTCYIILNKLLRDYNLSLSLMINPNRLDGFSLNELIEIVKEGQKTYENLLKNQNKSFFIINTNEHDQALKEIKCPAVDLISHKELVNEFVQKVMVASNVNLNTSSQTNSFFKEDKTKNMLNELRKFSGIDSVIVTFETGNYSLAFRKACASKQVDLVNLFLKNQAQLQFNINELSSNNYSALDWFEKNTPPSKKKEDTIKILIENGALNGTDVLMGKLSLVNC